MSEQRLSAVRQQLEAMRADYRQRTRDTLDALALRLESGQDVVLLDETESLLHKLAGSGGSFGFAMLSREARRMELALRQRRAQLGAAEMPLLGAQLRALIPLLEQPDQGAAPVSAPETRGEHGRVLLWAGQDQPGDERLRDTLERFGHPVSQARSRGDLADLLDAARFELLLVDLQVEGSADIERQATLAYVGELRAERRLGHALLFALSSMDSLPLRLEAARVGASGFFARPFDPVKVVDRLERLREQQLARRGRVLLVDDDQLLARHHAAVLEMGGFEVKVCTDPLKALDAMSRFNPDLVLVDLYMPGCSGPELARVIRMHDEWLAIPLVFLSAETDLELQIDAASEGADDFLTKPIADAHLIGAVRARFERARQVAQLIHSDSLTGLLKHGRIKEELLTEVARAQRHRQPLCLMMLDIDHFKQVNDRFGHPVGDQVLRALGNLLRQRARKSDRLGRYGGEEFMLILPDCAPEDGRLLAEDIRERFSALRFTAGKEEFAVTLSAGLAAFPGIEDPGELLTRADQALYAAKQNGRNRVELAA